MSGCPGSGKSTIARAIGRQTGAAILDHDVIKSALLNGGVPFDAAGRGSYQTAHAIAKSLLGQGLSVILDSPCYYQALLDNGMRLAEEVGGHYRYIECVTEDFAEIRRRLRTREPLRSQCVDLDAAPGDDTRRAQFASGEEMFRAWIRNMRRPAHSYLRVDTSRSVTDCMAEIVAFLGKQQSVETARQTSSVSRNTDQTER
jgi:predicted kinase